MQSSEGIMQQMSRLWRRRPFSSLIGTKYVDVYFRMSDGALGTGYVLV